MSQNKQSKGLGKGLEALLPTNHSALFVGNNDTDKIVHLEIIQVIPNKQQPRTRFIDNTIHELAQSISANGVLQPIIVTKTEQNKYSIVAGERRWRAAQVAGLKTIPVIIRSFDELQKLELGLIENIQREDLSPLDQAIAIKRLHEQFSQSYEQIAIKLGKAYTTVVNSTRLLQLPKEILDMLHEGKLSEGHARSLIALSKIPKQQLELANRIVTSKLSVRETEQLVLMLKNKSQAENAPSKNASKKPVTSEHFERYFGTKVTIKSGKRGGSVVISYKNSDDLERITKLISN